MLTNNTAEENRDYGIMLHSVRNSNMLTSNTANSSINGDGIHLWDSSTNTLTNNIAWNNRYGIYLADSSSENEMYLNNFINNTDNVYSSEDSTNIWDTSEVMTYTYNESTYTNYLGNYWSDYNGTDTDNDGIGDTSYSIDGDKDNYPLMEPFENYVPTPASLIFDTGPSENPYPSIMGNHTGTIRPNHTVIAAKLCTYPCAGTGGHTEYARIWNLTWNATATWGGYAGNWHNLSFDKTVVLLAGESYNYTIRTGSYPQLIHKSPFNATGGEITCTKFTDVNGKVYYDRIPAIRLE